MKYNENRNEEVILSKKSNWPKKTPAQSHTGLGPLPTRATTIQVSVSTDRWQELAGGPVKRTDSLEAGTAGRALFSQPEAP